MCVCHDVMQFELQNTTFSTYGTILSTFSIWKHILEVFPGYMKTSQWGKATAHYNT